ncbi:hypothetical protein ASZ90_014493 [hydrocarbon metagenome]|uniref:Uncharacterized protein n=1 Tax=hydrocarbon metagenome TaxID=938273 RepID=A0A0W8F4Q6_9ZZZZ
MKKRIETPMYPKTATIGRKSPKDDRTDDAELLPSLQGSKLVFGQLVDQHAGGPDRRFHDRVQDDRGGEAFLGINS